METIIDGVSLTFDEYLLPPTLTPAGYTLIADIRIGASLLRCVHNLDYCYPNLGVGHAGTAGRHRRAWQ
ncbi:hypothetical protein [Frankia sp. Cr1]|uniref:hypothetical protein n=1 Tax=Frankia sp. Cr1 TaxID=3073931 RepID=UPI002AD236A4|nr:hypothetical protein [Frankia sp. Cr1]